MGHTIIPVGTFDYFVFGATGDLSKRKLLPSLYHRFADGQIPKSSRIIGCARTDLDRDDFKSMVVEAIKANVPANQINQEALSQFLNLLIYQAIDIHCDDDWLQLIAIAKQVQDNRITIFYLSVGPSLYPDIIAGLKAHDLNLQARLVVEKPLGFDLSSSIYLNRILKDAFDETHIYRIDHYLGKETVQNLMALRFANAMFEPLWNSHYVDHVQITAAETIGLQGRGEYYDRAGAMRDMVQNHMLQLLCLSAMEPPAAFDADSVRDEKLKVLRSLQPLVGQQVLDNTVRGQYLAGDGIPSYLSDVDKERSQTESYVALRANIDNWRWAGTPFYLRTGKRLSHKMMEIAFIFRKTPHFIFDQITTPTQPNALVIRIQPNEGIDIEIMTKQPGHGGMRLRETILDTAKKVNESNPPPDAYQRLLLDVVRGDQTLFMRGDEVEAAWGWVDPIIEAWKASDRQLEIYDPSSEGPRTAEELMSREGRQWRKIH